MSNTEWVRWDGQAHVGLTGHDFYVSWPQRSGMGHMVCWGLRHIPAILFLPRVDWLHWRLTYRQALRLAIWLSNNPPPLPPPPSKHWRVEHAKREFAA